jgi:hypothetical protein
MISGAPWLQSPLAIAAIVCLLLGTFLIVVGVRALFKWRPLRFTVRTLSGLVLILAGALIGTISIGTYGYTALTSEEVVAVIEVQPSGPQRFDARFVYSDGRMETFSLSGDEIYVDARVLKWKSWAALAGLRTMYELDRVAGRYRAIDDERKNTRTVYSLGSQKPFDMFALRRSAGSLGRFVDAEYGSAAFVPADKNGSLELSVTASGLIIRSKPRS